MKKAKKNENEKKQEKVKNVAPEKGKIASANKNTRRMQVRFIYGELTIMSTLALGYPLLVHFRYVQAYY